MKNIIFKTKKHLVLCFLFASSILVAQTTYTVNNNPNTTANFTDLQTAIDAAKSGDIIYVQQSNMTYGDITINKALTLVGRSHSDINYKSEIGTINFGAGSSNSIFKGLKISALIEEFSTFDGVSISNLSFYDNDIYNVGLNNYDHYSTILFQGNVIFSVSSGARNSNFVFLNNFFKTTAIGIHHAGSRIFSNNIFYLNGSQITNSSIDGSILNFSNCLFLGPNNLNIYGNFQLNNCLTYSFNGDSITIIPSSTSVFHSVNNCLLNTNPLLTNVGPNNLGQYDPKIDSFILQPNSPAKGSGYGGVDMGVYENYNFKPFGTPRGVPSIKVESYSATVPKNGNLSVTIKTETN